MVLGEANPGGGWKTGDGDRRWRHRTGGSSLLLPPCPASPPPSPPSPSPSPPPPLSLPSPIPSPLPLSVSPSQYSQGGWSSPGPCPPAPTISHRPILASRCPSHNPSHPPPPKGASRRGSPRPQPWKGGPETRARSPGKPLVQKGSENRAECL